MSLHPTEGVRLLLERRTVADDGQSATYSAKVFTPTQVFCYAAELSMDGAAELAPEGLTAAADDEKRLLNIARSTARAARRNRDDGLPPWPHRILRWRK